MSRSTQVQRQPGSAGVSRSEPGGRAQGNASGRDAGRPPGVGDLPERVRELLPEGVADELLAGARGEEEIVGPGGLLSQLTKRLVERAMEVELTDHLVLHLKALQPLRLIGLHPAVLRPPPAERRFGDLQVPQHLSELLPLVQQPFALTDLPDCLLRRVPMPLHDRVHPPIPPRGHDEHTKPLAHITGTPSTYGGQEFEEAAAAQPALEAVAVNRFGQMLLAETLGDTTYVRGVRPNGSTSTLDSAPEASIPPSSLKLVSHEASWLHDGIVRRATI